MSAALVESVREAKDAETMQTLEIALYKLDLPAILAALTEAEALRAQVAEATTKCPHCGVGFLQAGEMQRVLDGVKDIRADYIRLVQEQATYYEHAKAKERETITVSRALAAGQAREVALREALETLARLGNGDQYGNSDGNRIAQAALSTPTDTAALRAMLEKAAGMGMSCGYSRCCSKLEAKSDADRNEIVDRALGGS